MRIEKRSSGIRSSLRSRDRGTSSDMSVVDLKLLENGIFLNEELRKCSGQIVIVDSGCPRSLLGDKNLKD